MGKKPFPGGKNYQGGLRRMKMPQEKNGENTDLKCDCAEIRTMRKEDITRLEAFEMKVWRRKENISWTEHISNEMLKLVAEERSLLFKLLRGLGGLVGLMLPLAYT